MLTDVLQIFKKEYEHYGDALITDSYDPADGDYVIVNPETFEVIDVVSIKMDKKTGKIDRSNEFFDFIVQADYLSKYISSNKAIKNKNIHSNNYLTFFIKKENVHKKLTNEIIEEYYNILRDPYMKYKDPSKSESGKLYKSFEEKYGKPNIEEIDKVESWIKNNIFKLVDEDSKDKSYLKIFFKYDLKTYKIESKRYVLINIYNSNDYNIEINGKTYGLPNDNMGMNSKKRYLGNKTRKVSIPYLLTEEEVLLQKRFFDYLGNQVSKNRLNIYLGDNGVKTCSYNETLDNDFKGYYLRLQKGMEVEIHDFDTIGLYKPSIGPIDVLNVIEDEDFKIPYPTIYNLNQLKDDVNIVFFNKWLTSNYFTDAKDIKIYDKKLKIYDNNLKRNLLLTRGVLFTWFYKGQANNVWSVLKNSSLDLIKGSIQKGYLKKSGEQFNLRCALKNYFEGGENMGDVLQNVKETLRNKINDKQTDSIDNDNEYYFAVGQLTNYFISLSKTGKKVHSLANPIINAQSDERIKEELKRLYKRYNYTIEFMSKRVNNLYAMISSYQPEGEVNEELIIAGYLHSNLIYEKKEEEK